MENDEREVKKASLLTGCEAKKARNNCGVTGGEPVEIIKCRWKKKQGVAD